MKLKNEQNIRSKVHQADKLTSLFIIASQVSYEYSRIFENHGNRLKSVYLIRFCVFSFHLLLLLIFHHSLIFVILHLLFFRFTIHCLISTFSFTHPLSIYHTQSLLLISPHFTDLNWPSLSLFSQSLSPHTTIFTFFLLILLRLSFPPFLYLFLLYS